MINILVVVFRSVPKHYTLTNLCNFEDEIGSELTSYLRTINTSFTQINR